jgi:transcriptional regulator with XRE-family HTH domain
VPHQALYDSLLQKLIVARQEAGFNQRDVSSRLGFSHSFLSKCETGERRIDVMELLQLAELYGKPPEFFLRDS